MQKLILPILLSIGFPALACPDLSGNYSCSVTDDMGVTQGFQLSITQEARDYSISTNGDAAQFVIADQISRPVPGNNEYSMVASCSGDALFMSMTGTLVADAQSGGGEFQFTVETTVTKDGVNLVQEMVSANSMGSTIYNTTICEPS